MHCQNLSYDKLPTWRHGRGWAGPWKAEWGVFKWHSPGIHVQAGGYEDNEIQFHASVGFAWVFVSRSFRRCFKDRELGVSWHDGSLWVKLWCDDDYYRDRPWHRNVICLHVKEWITGRPKYATEKGEPVECFVPMPEGCYRAIATPETSTWTYRFGFKKTVESWWLEIPNGGIPFSGKGENSWDCGDDGLCGIGGDTKEAAIGNAVANVLKYRRRYGHDTKGTGRHPAKICNGATT